MLLLLVDTATSTGSVDTPLTVSVKPAIASLKELLAERTRVPPVSPVEPTEIIASLAIPVELMLRPTASPSATTRPISPLEREVNSNRRVDGPEVSNEAVNGPLDLFSFSATSERVSVPVSDSRKVCEPLISFLAGPVKEVPFPRMPRSNAALPLLVSATTSVPVPADESTNRIPSPPSLRRA